MRRGGKKVRGLATSAACLALAAEGAAEREHTDFQQGKWDKGKRVGKDLRKDLKGREVAKWIGKGGRWIIQWKEYLKHTQNSWQGSDRTEGKKQGECSGWWKSREEHLWQMPWKQQEQNGGNRGRGWEKGKGWNNKGLKNNGESYCNTLQKHNNISQQQRTLKDAQRDTLKDGWTWFEGTKIMGKTDVWCSYSDRWADEGEVKMAVGRKYGYSNFGMRHKEQEKHMKKWDEQRKTWSRSRGCSFGGTQDQKHRPKETWTYTYNINLKDEERERKGKRGTRKQRNKQMHIKNGNGANREPEVDMWHLESLGKISPEGHLHHYTDGSVEGQLGAWASITEGEGAMSGVALFNREMASVLPEIWGMIAVLRKIQRNEDWAKHKHSIWTDNAQAIQLALGLNEWNQEEEGGKVVKQLREILEEVENTRDIKLKWCKGHSGIEGNELADMAAGIQIRKMKQEIESDKEGNSMRTEGNHRLTEHEGKTQLTPNAKLQIKPEDEDTEEWARLADEHKQILSRLYEKAGGLNITKEEAADKIWLIGGNLPQCRETLNKQILEGVVTAIRHGCGFYTELEKEEMGMVEGWITENWAEGRRRIEQARIGRASEEEGGAQKKTEERMTQMKRKREEEGRSDESAKTSEKEQNQKKQRSRHENTFWSYWKGSGGGKVKIYPIHLCAGAGIPELALDKAIDILNGQGYCIEVLQGERYENSKEANRIAKILGGKAEEMGNIENWPKRAAKLKAKEGTWLLVTGGTPCTKLTGLVKRWDSRARVGLHMAPSNLIFAAQEGIQKLQKENEGKVVCMMEQVIPAFKKWEEEIGDLLGFVKRTSTDNLNGQATRDRMYMRSHKEPQLDEWGKRLWEETEEEMRESNGFEWKWDGRWSRWPHNENSMENKPPTQKSYYPVLVLRQGNPDNFDALVDWEKQFLRKMKIHDGRGEGFYAGVREVATWMGLNRKEIEKIQQHYKCEQEVDRLQGQGKEYWKGKQGAPTEEDYTTCGKKAFCHNCTEVLKCLGNAWNKKVAVEEYVKVLLVALKGGKAFDYQKKPKHVCREGCSQIETVGEAKRQEMERQKEHEERMRKEKGIIEV